MKKHHTRHGGELIYANDEDDFFAYWISEDTIRIEVPLGQSHYDLPVRRAKKLGKRLQLLQRRRTRKIMRMDL